MKTEKDTTEKLNGRIIIDSYYALKRANAFLKFLHQVVVKGIAVETIGNKYKFQLKYGFKIFVDDIKTNMLFKLIITKKEFNDVRLIDSAYPFRLIVKTIKQKLKKRLAI